MDEYLHHPEHEYSNNQKHPDNKQDEIAGALKEDAEVMKHDLKYLAKLVQCYFDNEWSINYGECTWEEVQVGNDAHLYTLIKYNGKDIMVQVGRWEYNTAVFTKTGVEETRRLRNSPLPLFVVTAWADQEQKMSHPTRFLNEHAMIYSPKWWKVEARMTFAERKKPIDYGKGNGIMEYQKAITALQNTSIKKKFYDRENKKKNNLPKRLIDDMISLKNKNFEQFIRRYEVDPKFYYLNKKSVDVRECLNQLGDNDMEKVHNLIQRFNPQIWKFTPPNH